MIIAPEVDSGTGGDPQPSGKAVGYHVVHACFSERGCNAAGGGLREAPIINVCDCGDVAWIKEVEIVVAGPFS